MVVLWECILCTWWRLAVVLLELLRYFKNSQTPLGSFPTGQGIQYDCDSSLLENRELHVMSTMHGCLVRNPTISEVELPSVWSKLAYQNWSLLIALKTGFLIPYWLTMHPKHLHTQIARQPRTTSCWYICTSVNCGYVVWFYTCLKDKLFWKKYTKQIRYHNGIDI